MNQVTSNDVHIIIQEKGGVGKTLVASILAQYLVAHKGVCNLRCLDIDASNNSLSNYAALNAVALNLLKNGVITRQSFDPFYAIMAETEDAILADIGTSAAISFLSFARSFELYQQALDMGRRLFIHIVLMGGAEADDTLDSFSLIADDMPKSSIGEAYIVPWLNPFHGPLEFTDDRLPFEKTEQYRTSSALIPGIINMPDFGQDFNDALNEARKIGKTFAEVASDKSIAVSERYRVNKIRSSVYTSLDLLRCL